MLRALLTCVATGIFAVGCASAPKTNNALAASAPAKTTCVGPPTASRIPQSGCGPGQTYTQDEIRSSGQGNGQSGAAGALAVLDPLVHH
jgi:hypothetical protein